MSFFDALCHTFGTLATGGFSTYNASVGHFAKHPDLYNSAIIEYSIILFMILAGTNFTLLYLCLLRQPGRMLADVEWRAYMGLIALAFLIGDQWLVGLFTSDAAIVGHGADCLRIVAIGYMPFAVGMVLAQAFNGAGDTWTPTWLNLIAFWLLQIPLAWVLAEAFGFGPRGVYAAITIGETVLAILMTWQYRRGRWVGTAV